jgi:glycerophosphoryl diester phosphodiesterase
MILISHRGNINGCNFEKENTHEYIQQAIDAGFHVEIDVWLKNNQLFLGHDQPETPVYLDWLIERKEKLWVHTKNAESLFYLTSNTDLTVFFHEEEKYSIINNGRNNSGTIIKGVVWAHNLEKLNKNCIIPLLSKNDLTKKPTVEILGVCSDYVELIKNENR